MSLFKKTEPYYRPWESDEWKSLFKAADLRLSRERVYTLAQYLEWSLCMPGDVIEMGVYKGCTAYILAYFLNAYVGKIHKNTNGERVLYLCDTFSGTPDKFDKLKGDINRGGKYSDTSLKFVYEKITACYEKTLCIEGNIPKSLACIPIDAKFCFAHIHLNLYSSTKDAILWLKDRISQNGIIIVEDYGIFNCNGVKNAVDELARDNIIDNIYLPNGQAIIRFKMI